MENSDVELKKSFEFKQKMLKIAKEKYLKDSKDRLSKITERKIRTAFIGALSQFETFFGFLFGELPETLTKEQQAILIFLKDNNLEDLFKDAWQKTREKVLTNGNNQIRGIIDEFEHYTIHWDRYNIVLPVKDLPNN